MDRPPAGHRILAVCPQNDRASLLEKQNPHMTKLIFESGLCLAMLLAWTVDTCDASEKRMTPLVRAVQQAKNSVVNIHSEKTTYPSDSVFTNGRGRKVSGMGTGIVVDGRGYIVTNHHVVEDVDSLQVTLDDGSTYTARTISFDRAHDLAIIKIDATRVLPVMPMGTSSDVMLGETVFAVGNAFGYEHTITSGIISALSRDVEVNEKQSYKNLIQTDASINPGNSGGPLLNLDGEVIGINVAIRAGAQRIGFAIPIDDARQIIARLLSIQELDNNMHGLVGRDVKSTDERKLIVEETVPDSPAARAGVQRGDIVLKAGEIEVLDGADFERAMLGRRPGDKVSVQVKRGDRVETLDVTLAQAGPRSPSLGQTAVASQSTEVSFEDKAWQILGIQVESISTGDRQYITPRYRGGLRVAGVRNGSPAALNGVQKGDILVGLHIWETLNVDNVAYVLDHPQLATFSPLKFYIVREGQTLYGHLNVAMAVSSK